MKVGKVFVKAYYENNEEIFAEGTLFEDHTIKVTEEARRYNKNTNTFENCIIKENIFYEENLKEYINKLKEQIPINPDLIEIYEYALYCIQEKINP